MRKDDTGLLLMARSTGAGSGWTALIQYVDFVLRPSKNSMLLYQIKQFAIFSASLSKHLNLLSSIIWLVLGQT
jgi:hypothetical protein